MRQDMTDSILYSIFTENASHVWITLQSILSLVVVVITLFPFDPKHHCRERVFEHQLQDFSCHRNTLWSPAVFWRVNHCISIRLIHCIKPYLSFCVAGAVSRHWHAVGLTIRQLLILLQIDHFYFQRHMFIKAKRYCFFEGWRFEG